MKKIWILIIILVIILSMYIYSSARQRVSLPMPEDMAGQEASAFLPKQAQGRPAATGSGELKVTGPVWVEK
jgi:hypothetical protein